MDEVWFNWFKCYAAVDTGEQGLLNLYARGNRNFREIKLGAVVLARKDLRSVNLRGAYLEGACLHRADLREAILDAAHLEYAGLNVADLQGARLHGAYLCHASLREARVSHTILSLADLTNANLTCTNLEAADLSGAILTGACLVEADLRGALLNGTDMSSANLSGADLRAVDLSTTKLDGANLVGALLDDAKLPHGLAQSFNRMNNQGIAFKPNLLTHTWEGLRFRSKTEIKIAQALDRVGVLFLPNCLARLNDPEKLRGRGNIETDFLVCHHSMWGILEVDGPHHTAARRVKEQERERLFRRYGIRTYERFEANKCYAQADEVVKDFLEMMKAMHN